ncbi:MAG: DUF2804 domain-containing protein [Oscillospiraceae bacterium]|nr:DUF2804 domain-containing protein [Oscillospiraceae bacterium]
MNRTYSSFMDWKEPSRQTEYVENTPLLAENGTLLAKGWARKNVFRYDRDRVRHVMRRKEWDFYQISDGRLMLQISFANISLGGYASVTLVDLRAGKTLVSDMAPFVGGKDRYILPARGDVPNYVGFRVGKAFFEANTGAERRTLRYTNGDLRAEIVMEIMPGLENITTVLPFEGFPDRYFMTTKQNCMPCEGTVTNGSDQWRFEKPDSFCVLDWGRVCTPYSLVWYWGNGSGWVQGNDGQKHLFGFEITWGIGDESNATETCVFYDGKAHKIGAVDVETFPKPDQYMKPWHFLSEDGRFNLTMEPFYDHHSDLNVGVMRMHSHQVHGNWNGTVTLDDGSVIRIRDFYAFCEYVENRW